MIELHQSELMPEVWLTYKTPLIRQLAFSVASPNILSAVPEQLPIQHTFEFHANAFWQKHYQAYQSRLAYLDSHPEAVYEFLNQLKSTRLGLRFEMLMWFWLRDRDYHPFELLGTVFKLLMVLKLWVNWIFYCTTMTHSRLNIGKSH